MRWVVQWFKADGTVLYRMKAALACTNVRSGGIPAKRIIHSADMYLSWPVATRIATPLSQPVIHDDETAVQVLKERAA